MTGTPYYTEYGLNTIDQTEDCSAIKYYVQAYYFTKWVETLGIKDSENIEYLKVSETNNPEDVDSAFYKHKQEVIKGQINNSLAQAIRNYAGESAQDYRLPELTLNDWDQILSNVSMVTFMQQIPVGFKTYNNYAIATSTNNREVVDPDEIYFINDSDEYYHRCYCDKTAGTGNLTGYRSVDFVERNYTIKDADDNEETNYYFLHNTDDDGVLDDYKKDDIKASMSCYYCLINRADYTETKEDSVKNSYTIAYNTALARERYKSKQDVILAKEYAEFEVEKKIAKINEKSGTFGDDTAEVGDEILWEITIRNKGKAAGTAYVDDYSGFPKGLEINDYGGLEPVGTYGDSKYGAKGYITVDAGVTQTITVKTIVKSDVNLGQLTNIVIIKNEETSDISIDQASADVKAEKTVTVTTSSTASKTNVILILDNSSSMNFELSNVRKQANQFLIDDLKDVPNLTKSVIYFNNSAGHCSFSPNGEIAGYIPLPIANFGTNYLAALNLALDDIDTSEGTRNIVIFMTDGGPTVLQTEFSGIPIISGIFGILGGGWMETFLVGRDENTGEYKYNWDLFLTVGLKYPDSAGVIEKLWETESSVSGIIPAAKKIKSKAEMHCIYYNTHLTTGEVSPAYGLKVLSSDNGDTDNSKFFHEANNVNALREAFKEIGKSATPTEELTSVKTEEGYIEIEKLGTGFTISKINNIVIDGTEISLDEAKAREYITTDGKLNVNKIGPEKTIEIRFNS